MRKEVLEWKLDDLWPVDDFDKKLRSLREELVVLHQWFDELSSDMGAEKFREIMWADELLGDMVSRLGMLPGLMETVNQKDPRAKLWKRKISEIMLEFNLVSIRIGRWLRGLKVEGKKKLSDTEAKRLFAAVREIEGNLWFDRKLAKHSLEEREEDIIDNKDLNGLSVLTDIRSLMESEHVFEWGKRRITQSELMKFVYDRDSEKRKRAYELMLAKHKEEIDKSFLIYQAVVKDWLYEMRLRGYKSAIEMRNLGNRVTDKSIEALLTVCRRKRKIFWRFFDWKAGQLGLKKINRSDLYASLDTGGRRNGQMSLGEAKKIIFESFGEFSSGFRDRAEKIFEDEHIDSHPRRFKESGAFCATASPKVSPYIMLNFAGTVRDMSTLAHELGHGIHSLYANKQWPSAQHAGLPLAETASTLGEMIVFEKMLGEERDQGRKKMMLADKLTDAYATILRQNYIIVFELEVFARMKQGAMTERDLSDLWYQLLREQLGPGVVIDKLFRYEWAYISHIFNSPFYCYAYNFGELLSMSLYKRYKEEGSQFVTKIEGILEMGGSIDPTVALRGIGIDIEGEEFWEKSFEVLEEWVDRVVTPDNSPISCR